jgi:hypothetical protein
VAAMLDQLFRDQTPFEYAPTAARLKPVILPQSNQNYGCRTQGSAPIGKNGKRQGLFRHDQTDPIPEGQKAWYRQFE